MKLRILPLSLVTVATLGSMSPTISWSQTPPAKKSLPPVTFSENEMSVIYDENIFPAMEAMAKQAKKQIRAAWFIFGGPQANALVKIMGDKIAADPTFKARIILDAKHGSVERHKQYTEPTIDYAKSLGVEVIDNNTKAVLRVNGPGVKGSNIAHTLEHSKYLVVDEEMAAIGSSNIAPDFFKDLDTPMFHDLMVFVKGPIAKEMAQTFDFDYDNATVFKDDINRPAKGLRIGPATPPKIHPPTSKVGYARLLGTGIGRETGYQAILQALDSAKRSIKIQMHEMADTPVILERLLEARRRGVKVQIIFDPNDTSMAFSPESLFPMDQTMAAKVKKFVEDHNESFPRSVMNACAIRALFRPDNLADATRLTADAWPRINTMPLGHFMKPGKGSLEMKNFRVVKKGDMFKHPEQGNRMYSVAHMKSVIIDEEVFIAGSINWTRGGFHDVGEMEIQVFGGQVPKQASDNFAKDWKTATPVVMQTWPPSKVLAWPVAPIAFEVCDKVYRGNDHTIEVDFPAFMGAKFDIDTLKKQ